MGQGIYILELSVVSPETMNTSSNHEYLKDFLKMASRMKATVPKPEYPNREYIFKFPSSHNDSKSIIQFLFWVVVYNANEMSRGSVGF